jgi:hypothetical protein
MTTQQTTQQTTPLGHVIVPTKLAALAAGVPEATIRKWASRGKLTRYGRPGRAEYDLDELYELAAAQQRAEPGPATARVPGSETTTR